MSHRYLYLFLSQLTLVVIYPFLEERVGLRLLLEAILLLALVGGVIATIANRRRFVLSLTLGGVFLTARWSVDWLERSDLAIVSLTAGAAFFAYITFVMMLHIFVDRKRVDADVIIGSLSVYMLLGVTFGFVYMTFDLLVPGSFAGIEQTAGDTPLPQFIYFSFVTLTTLGYGDITPVGQQAGVLAYFEAMMGQVYLTVLVARLVAVHIAQQGVSR